MHFREALDIFSHVYFPNSFDSSTLLSRVSPTHKAPSLAFPGASLAASLTFDAAVLAASFNYPNALLKFIF